MDISPLPDALIAHGDLVRVTFDPPYRDADHAPIAEATGTILRVSGLTYLQAVSHRSAWQMRSSSISTGPAGGSNGSSRPRT